MTPFSFDLDTCKEVLGDAEVRRIEASARSAAETFWGSVTAAMVQVVYSAAYEKRAARLKRKENQ